MVKLPNKPDRERLSDISPSLSSIPAGTTLHRIYRRGGEHPSLWNTFRYFGPTAARFDHHLQDSDDMAHLQDRGILYAATDIITAIAEVFQEKRTVNRSGDQPWLVSYTINCDIKLLDLTGTFALQAGGSMKLASGPTLYSQNWSRAFYDCYEEIAGIYFLSSLTNRPVMALYERAQRLELFPKSPRFHRALGDALLLEPVRNACKEIGHDFA